LEVGGKTKNIGEGSFFDYISKGCGTGFGKRLLKRWVVSPLFNKEKIE
jgi:DNA mismatch repair ATPase MutS